MTRKAPPIGHNVNEAISVGELRLLANRIEKLEEEKAEIADGIKAIYAEAKAKGFHTPALKRVIRERKMDPEKLAAYIESASLYRDALGVLADTPLGHAAQPSANDEQPPQRPGKKPEATDPPEGNA